MAVAPVEVRDHGDGRGRGLFASRAIASGEVYFRASPFAAVAMQEWLRNVCVGCMAFTPTVSMPVSCGCGCTHYCSAKCRARDAQRHAIECVVRARDGRTLRVPSVPTLKINRS